MKKIGVLESVREARHRISERFDHDPVKVIEHYIELQEKYKDRLVAPKEEKGHENAAK
ncbi:MAG: hypothetical protein GY703_15510 [Gammaproteobacteria bacterium]|nr:hypothetical protein [Gammaproteobacteria bacterium]